METSFLTAEAGAATNAARHTNITTAEAVVLAAHYGAHHVRLLAADGETVAHSAALEATWDSPGHEAAMAAYALIDRASPSARHADCALRAALAAMEELLSAALLSGALRAEIKVGAEWRPMP